MAISPHPDSAPFKSGHHLGEPAIYLSAEDEVRLAAPLKMSLTGRFVRKSPSIESIKKFFQSGNFRDKVQIGKLSKSTFLFRCAAIDDYVRLRTKGTWFIEGCRVRTSVFSPESWKKSETSTAPIWISLPNLPIQLFHKDFLFSIAHQIGDPITLDNATKSMSRPTCARVCVDVELSSPLIKRVWIQGSQDGFWQPLIYEKLPPFCYSCAKMGHNIADCRRPSDRNLVNEQHKRISENRDLPLVNLVIETPAQNQMQDIIDRPSESTTSPGENGRLKMIDTSQSGIVSKETSRDYGLEAEDDGLMVEVMNDLSSGEESSLPSSKLLTANGIDKIKHGNRECTDTESMVECISTEYSASETQVSANNVETPDAAFSGITECSETESSVNFAIESPALEQELFVDKKVEPKNLGSNNAGILFQEQDHSTSVTAAAMEPINHLPAKSQGSRLKSQRSIKASVSNRKQMHMSKGLSWRNRRSKNLRKKPTWSRGTISLAAKDLLRKHFYNPPKCNPKLLQKVTAYIHGVPKYTITKDYPP